jgi:hypothetical protein
MELPIIGELAWEGLGKADEGKQTVLNLVPLAGAWR